MQNKILTILIMTFDRPEYLSECLDSIDKQSFKNFDLIVSDNGSSKDYSKVINKFKHLNIEYIKHEGNNRTTVDNYRYCFGKKISTKYIMVFHDDDIMHPNLLSSSINILEDNKNIAWTNANYKSFNIQLSSNFFEEKKITFSKFNQEDLICKLINYNISIAQSSVIYRYDIFENVDLEFLLNKFNIHFDRPFMFDCLNNHDCAIIDQDLVGYRLHSQQISKYRIPNEEYLFNIFLAYKKPLKKFRNICSYFLFMSSFLLLVSYKDISNKNKKNIFSFYFKAIKFGVTNYLFPLFIITGLIKFILDLGIRKFFSLILKKIRLRFNFSNKL